MKKLFEKIRSFLKNKLARRIAIFLAIFTTIVVVECTAFNYRSYIDRGQKFDVDISGLVVSNVTKNVSESTEDKYVYTMNTSKMPSFMVNFIDVKEVNTIYFDINFEDEAAYRYMFTVNGYYNEDGHTGYVSSSCDLEIIPGDEHTKYFVTDFNHPISRLEIKMLNVGNYGSGSNQDFTFSIGKLGLNYRVKFHFSWARVLLLLGAASILLPFRAQA